MTASHIEAAFESVIAHHLLDNGCVFVPCDAYDRARAIVPSVVLAFIRETQPPAWGACAKRHP